MFVILSLPAGRQAERGMKEGERIWRDACGARLRPSRAVVCPAPDSFAASAATPRGAWSALRMTLTHVCHPEPACRQAGRAGDEGGRTDLAGRLRGALEA